MSITHIAGYVQSWFGYFGSCINTSDLSCKPFLAFVGLSAASAVMFAMVCAALSACFEDLARVVQRLRDAHHEERVAASIRAKIASQMSEARAAPAEVRIEPTLAAAAGTADTAVPGEGSQLAA